MDLPMDFFPVCKGKDRRWQNSVRDKEQETPTSYQTGSLLRNEIVFEIIFWAWRLISKLSTK